MIYNRIISHNDFDGIVVSGTEKMIKPEKEIYHVLLKRYQLEASQSLFIDDSIANIETARHIGFHTIHFANGTNLEHELKSMEII